MVSICSRVMVFTFSLRRRFTKGTFGGGAPNNPDCSRFMKPSDSVTQPLQAPQATRREGGDRHATEPPAPLGRPLAPKNAGSERPPRPDEIVVLRDIKKTFQDQEVLKGVDLVARRRETTVIIG